MCPGDEFSIKTTISQLGNVARAQVKSQQAANTQSPTATHKTDQEKRVERVHEAEQAEKNRLKPDERRRERGGGQPQQHEDPAPEDGEELEKGTYLDTKA
jgi:hypothetical protein